MLENIHSPSDIKNLSQKEVKKLAQELRETIIQVVGQNGGHLASNLGVVELSIALHRVFESPNDAFIWDVSHQCYAHKLLTGRFEKFSTLRKEGGISGFTNIDESVHDYFTAGHSSTSISSALGLLTSWQLQGKEGKVVAVIGDGALTGGMAFEALCHTGQLKKNLIVIVNDNQMSIDHNTGAISRYLSKLTVTGRYQNFKHRANNLFKKFPVIGSPLEKGIHRVKRSLKGLLLTNNLFVDLGFEYVGPLNGHDEESLETVFRRVKSLKRPVVIHIVTKKGKGYSPAENHPEVFHGIGPFQISDGHVEKFDTLSFTEAFSNLIIEKAEENKNIVAITAAMAKGTGLSAFSRKFPNRFFDVGIAEEHAVTFAGGLAKGGLLPVVCIYSTFLQRSVDQIIHDISLQRLHTIFMLDRAGAVPDDGVTHQGVFDIALFRSVPNVTILSPASAVDLKLCFEWALNADGAIFIRYPKLSCPEEIPEFSTPVEKGKGIFIPNESFSTNSDSSVKGKSSRKNRTLVICTGGMYAEVRNAVIAAGDEDNAIADVLLLRFIKPLDEEYLISLAKEYKNILFVEDGIKINGISEYLNGLFAENGLVNTKVLAFEDKYYEHGNREQVLRNAGFCSSQIKDYIKDCQ